MRGFEPFHTTDAAAPGRMVTTLYELIETLHAQVTPGEDDLVIAAMQKIINTRRLAFVDLDHAHRLKCA